MSPGTAENSDRLEHELLQELELFLKELHGHRALGRLHLRGEASLGADLGLGSLERVEFLSRLERRYRVKFTESALAEAETPSALVRAIRDAEKAGETTRDRPPTRARSYAPPSDGQELPTDAETLVEVLERRARGDGDRPHVVLEQDDDREDVLSFGALHHEALTVAASLQAAGVAEGETVAVMLPTGREFFVAFMGIQLAGGIPVPLYPPASLARIRDYAVRQAGILKNAGARHFVTIDRARPVGTLLRGMVDSLERVVTLPELLDATGPRAPEKVSLRADTPALVQYTSGSTGEPKGVLLTHRNLLANIRVMGSSFEVTPTDYMVSWLPLYHDMGLIGAWLAPLYYGIPVAITSPLRFLARPERWLWSIHRHRATISAAPNFAYELALRKIPDSELEGLDLSSWRVALNGAEPVAAATVLRFQERFGRCGFSDRSLTPVYGLAESSLLLAAPEPGSRVRLESVDRDLFERDARAEAVTAEGRGMTFVSAGKVVPDHEIRILDEAGRELPERREGRIAFRGPSAMQGYYRNPAATEEVRDEEGFIDSGDRAFVIDGELFVTGRDKDLIIRGGRNLVPQEIERLVSEVEGVRAGCVVAFGAADPRLGTERVVVLAETRQEVLEPESEQRLLGEIQRRLSEVLDSPADELHLLPARRLPKTSSGKLRRADAKELYLAGELLRHRHKSRPYRLWIELAARVSVERLRRTAKRVGDIGYSLYVSGLTAVVVPAVWLVALFVPHRRFLQGFLRRSVRGLLRLAGVRLEVRGSEYLAKAERESFVFIANHASYLDALPVIAALPLDFAFVVKQEAAHWPIIGTFITRLGHLPIERVQVKESAESADRMLELLEAGRSIVLFPEGTFSYASGIRPFKLGAFEIAQRSGRKLVPIALVGTRRWLRDGTWIPRCSPISVIISEPRHVQLGASFSELTRLREEMADAMAKQVGEPRLELISAGVSPP